MFAQGDRIILFIAAMLVGQPYGRAQSADLQADLTALERYEERQGEAVLAENIVGLRRTMLAGDRVAWSRLRAILTDPNRPIRLRAGVLRLAADKSDEYMAMDVLKYVRGVLDRYEEAQKTRGGSPPSQRPSDDSMVWSGPL